MGIALLLGKVFLLLKTFVILSSNNWCFLFFHMTMFDKYLVVLFLYFCHLHSQLHLQHDCPGSWILRWLVVSTWCLFFIIIVDFFVRVADCQLNTIFGFCLLHICTHSVVVSIVFWTNGGWLHGNGLMSVFVFSLFLPLSLSLSLSRPLF